MLLLWLMTLLLLVLLFLMSPGDSAFTEEMTGQRKWGQSPVAGPWGDVVRATR